MTGQQDLRNRIRALKESLASVVYGQDRVLEQVIVSVLCGGHLLLEGVPGLAKTMLLSHLSGCLSLKFNRIQMTPDLMPSDITGTVILAKEGKGQERVMRFLKGPIFADLLLADEINRSPPKTQAALLEAMEERQVTVGGEAMDLGEHFRVVATQNPIEQEGTYPLPFAQADRFLMKIEVSYPDRAAEALVAERGPSKLPAPEPIASGGDLLAIADASREVWMPGPVEEYAHQLVRGTRPDDSLCPDSLRSVLAYGAGVRASQALASTSRMLAWLEGRSYVDYRDIARVAAPVMRHRLLMRSYAEAEGVSADDVVNRLLGMLKRPEIRWEVPRAIRRMLPGGVFREGAGL